VRRNPHPGGGIRRALDAIGSRYAKRVERGRHLHCIIAMAREAQLVPGVCGVCRQRASRLYRHRAGLSATGDIFNAIAKRASRALPSYQRGLDVYKAGQTGLLRLSWDNGDRTVLVNPETGGVTLGWNCAYARRTSSLRPSRARPSILASSWSGWPSTGVRVDRVINAGGIPQKNDVLNQVYANVLNKASDGARGDSDQPGRGIFALLAAGAYKTIEEAQDAVCLPLRTVQPDPKPLRSTNSFTHTIAMCIALGRRDAEPVALGRVLPELRKIAAQARKGD